MPTWFINLRVSRKLKSDNEFLGGLLQGAWRGPRGERRGAEEGVPTPCPHPPPGQKPGQGEGGDGKVPAHSGRRGNTLRPY